MEGVVGVYIPIHVWTTLGINVPDGAVVHRLTRSKNLPIAAKANAAPSPYLARFEDIWSRYPKMLGKKQACRSFLATVKTDKDWSDINLALENYKKIMPTDEQYIKHGATWFSNWQDYLTVQHKQQGFVKSL